MRTNTSGRADTSSLNIAVIGAGAVGGFYGAKLKQHGFSVEFFSGYLARDLYVKSIWGDFRVFIDVFQKTESMKPADIIIIATKVLPSGELFSLIRPVLKPQSFVLFLQNGIHQEEKFEEFLRKNKLSKEYRLVLLGGLAFTCIHRISPGEIHHLDYGMVKIGALRKEENRYAKMVVEIFRKAGIESEAVSNLRKARWEKLLWNAAFNTLSVAGQSVTTDRIMSSSHGETLATLLMKEILKIAEHEKQSPGAKKIKEMLEKTRKMKPYKTSMLLDYEARRPMEIDAILGEPLQLAKKYGIEVPVLNFAYHLLKFIEEKHKENKLSV